MKTLYISGGEVKAIAYAGVTITLDPPADLVVEVPTSEYWSIGDAYPRSVSTANGTGAGGGEQRPPTA